MVSMVKKGARLDLVVVFVIVVLVEVNLDWSLSAWRPRHVKNNSQCEGHAPHPIKAAPHLNFYYSEL